MSLISSSTITEFTGIMEEHYDTFKREIIIFKEPTKIFGDINSNGVYGYGEPSNENNISYISNSGVFYGRVRHDTKQDDKPLPEIGIRIPRGGCVIKVESNCRDYILNGKTEIVKVDGKDFNIISDFGCPDYLGWKRYWFMLENTP